MLLAVEYYHYIWATLYATICVLLILVILLQRGRGSGLAGAFGGAGGSSMLGAKTGDILTKITLVLAGVYILLAIVMNYYFVEVTPNVETPTVPPGGGPPAPPLAEPGALGASLFGDPAFWPQPHG